MDLKPKHPDCKNCTRLFRGSEYDPDEPFSSFCIGYRTGIINGKEQALENVPSDVFVVCVLIGNHSEDCGQHRHVFNIDDFYLELRTIFIAMERAGLLERIIERTIRVTSESIEQALRTGLRNAKRMHVITVGCKFIEFNCSCGERFFREYNEDHGGSYYTPTEQDRQLFKIHEDLGHTIMYKKARRVKHSKVDNKYWQTWGPSPTRSYEMKCVDCGTTENMIYMKPGEERCQTCAAPIFEKMKKDREWMKER